MTYRLQHSVVVGGKVWALWSSTREPSIFVMALMIKEIYYMKSCVPFLSIPFISVCKVEQIYIYIRFDRLWFDCYCIGFESKSYCNCYCYYFDTRYQELSLVLESVLYKYCYVIVPFWGITNHYSCRKTVHEFLNLLCLKWFQETVTFSQVGFDSCKKY